MAQHATDVRINVVLGLFTCFLASRWPFHAGTEGDMSFQNDFTAIHQNGAPCARNELLERRKP
jgi:hypothetical protein